MRVFKFFLLTAAFVFFVSCSKENDNPVNSTMILGEWSLAEFTYSGTTKATQGGETVTTTYSGEAFDLDARIIFNDATNYQTEGSYTVKLTTMVYGQTIVQDYPFSDISGTGTYRIEGNKIFTTANLSAGTTVVNPMGTSEGTIMELTPNRIVITGKQEVNSTMQGAQVQIINDIYQVLTR